jgi:acyl-CoA synthetase (NDP forming)
MSTANATRRRNLARLLRPRHLAFIGGDHVAAAIRSSRANGFEGTLSVVNPKRAEIEGVRSVRTVSELPIQPDAAFIAVPRDATIETVAALAARGAGGAVCYASGFAEAGVEGREAQERLVAAAGEMALVGPNCYGLIDARHGASLWPIDHRPWRVERGPAFIAQSGNLAINVTVNDRSIDFAYAISAGNQAVLGIEDFIDVLADDPGVSAIGLYLEGLRDAQAFADAVRKAHARGIGIVVLKAGKSALGQRLTVSHTASLAGSDAIYRGFFERIGVAEVSSVPAMLESLKILDILGAIRGNRIIAFTCSGGDSNTAADTAERCGLEFPQPPAERHAALARLLPPFASVTNPLDYTTALWGREADLHALMAAMLENDHDIALLVIDYIEHQKGENAGMEISINAFTRARAKAGRPGAILSVLPESMPDFARKKMKTRGVAALQGMADGLAGLASAVTVGRARARLDAGDPDVRLLGRAHALQWTRTLDEWESKGLLAKAGITVPDGAIVTAGDAADAAERIGFPVALKIASADIPHKSDFSAVRLGLNSRAEVEEAVAAISRAVSATGLAPTSQRFLVETMIDDGVAELLLGVVSDPVFGLVLMLASGGTLVELVADRLILIPPVTEAAAGAAIDSLRAARLLEGYRGRPAGDRQAVIDTIVAVARFAERESGRLIELDINPLIVRTKGKGAIAADALIRLM